jgi:putative SOS response-associated peptidase YedK
VFVFSSRITFPACLSSSAAGDAICPATCGRVHLSSEVEKLIEVFAIPPSRPAPNVAASWNVAPTDPLPVVRYDGKTSERSLDGLRLGLVPRPSRLASPTSTSRPRASTLGRPSARHFSARRCLVPVDNFYGRARTASGKQPYAIALADRGIMTLAGLWETWRSPAGEWVRSVAIVTTVPNALCGEIHNRMPVILKPAVWPVWLVEEPPICRSSRRCWSPILPRR